MINKNAKINPSSRIRTSDLWMTTAPLQSTTLPTELGLGEDRLMEGGKREKGKKGKKKEKREKGGEKREKEEKKEARKVLTFIMQGTEPRH